MFKVWIIWFYSKKCTYGYIYFFDGEELGSNLRVPVLMLKLAVVEMHQAGPRAASSPAMCT